MFGDIKKKLLDLFPNNTVQIEHKSKNLLPTRQEYDIKIPRQRIIAEFSKEKNNILIIDDSRGIVSIVEDMIRDIGKDKETLNLDNYNILSFFDRYAPFVLKETLETLKPLSIEYAVIDIMLPGKIKVEGVSTRMDGVDVAILLHSEYGCENFIFFTGNTLAEYVDYISDKMHKFKDYFNKDMEDYIIFKGANRPIVIDGNIADIQTEEVDVLLELKALFDKTKYTH
jgi:CheY-like chemotaxis protein